MCGKGLQTFPVGDAAARHVPLPLGHCCTELIHFVEDLYLRRRDGALSEIVFNCSVNSTRKAKFAYPKLNMNDKDYEAAIQKGISAQGLRERGSGVTDAGVNVPAKNADDFDDEGKDILDVDEDLEAEILAEKLIASYRREHAIRTLQNSVAYAVGPLCKAEMNNI